MPANSFLLSFSILFIEEGVLRPLTELDNLKIGVIPGISINFTTVIGEVVFTGSRLLDGGGRRKEPIIMGRTGLSRIGVRDSRVVLCRGLGSGKSSGRISGVSSRCITSFPVKGIRCKGFPDSCLNVACRILRSENFRSEDRSLGLVFLTIRKVILDD